MQAKCPLCSNVFEVQQGGVRPCPSCGQQINIPGVPSVYAPPAVETHVVTDSGVGAPWERRNELGFFKALWLTWTESMFTPEKFWKSLRPDGEWTTALVYAWVLNAMTLVLAIPLAALRLNGDEFEKAASASEPLRHLLEAVPMGVLVGGYGVGALILYPLGFIIGGSIFHVSAMLAGASKNGWNATLRAFGYSQSATLLAVIPYVGFVGALYSYVLMALGLKELHQTTMARAVIAVVLPIVFVCCCAGAVGALTVGGLAGLAK